MEAVTTAVQIPICRLGQKIDIFKYNPMKCYHTYYSLHYLQEILYNTTGTDTPGEQKAVSTRKESADS